MEYELIQSAMKQLIALHDELKQGDRLTDYKYVDFGRRGDRVQIYTTPTGSSFSVVYAGIEVSVMQHRNDLDVSAAGKEAVALLQRSDFWSTWLEEIKKIIEGGNK